MDHILGYLLGVIELINRTYVLDRGALDWIRGHPSSAWLSLGVVLLACASLMLGHGVVLLVNRVHGWAFVLGTAVSAVGMVGLYLVEALLLWGVGSLLTGRPVSFTVVLTAVFASSAPQLWAFLVLIPYLGPAIGRFLSAWSGLCLWVISIDTFGLNAWTSLGLVAGSWLVVHLLSTVASPLITRVVAAVFRLITGREFVVSGADILAGRPLLAAEARP